MLEQECITALLLFLTFGVCVVCALLSYLLWTVLVANPEKLLYTVANPARGLLNRGGGSLAAYPPPLQDSILSPNDNPVLCF